MILNYPKFWNSKNSVFSLILLPISIIYFFVTKINEKTKILKKKKFKIKIICCGNILVGGTGKTPLTVKIYNELSKDKKCCTIKKYRYEHIDEINFLKKNSNLLAKNTRLNALEEAEKKCYEYAILDDGSQDYSFDKNVLILCIKSKNEFGNQYILPSGPLREPMSKIKDYNFAVINGNKNNRLEKLIKKYNNKIKIFYSRYEISNSENYFNKKYLAFSGIANNSDFFEILIKSNINVIIKKEFSDHHMYSEDEINTLIKIANKNNLHLITTEKDYLRISNNFQKKINYIKLNLTIDNINQFIQDIKHETN